MSPTFDGPRSCLSVARSAQGAALLIDGTPLLTLIRAIELPQAEAEVAERNAAAPEEPPISVDDLAGHYVSLPLSEIALPSRALLGEMEGSRMGFADTDPRRGKTVLLLCDCGFVECWSLLARVTVLRDRVVWSDFEHACRSWTYDLLFVFDREAYEDALRRA